MSLEKSLYQRGPTDFFVARPILAVVLNLLIAIAGLAALKAVDVREMPDVNQPVVSVRTIYEGAVPETVDKEVTQVLEDALTALDGLFNIESSSTSGESTITIDLSDDVDVEIAANEAREIVASTLGQLPEDIEDPIVTKADTSSDAIIRLALLGDASFDELSKVAEGAVYDRLSRIDGIAEVNLRGDQTNEFRVNLNIPSLLSRGLTVFDVSTALSVLRSDTPLGDIESSSQSISLRIKNNTVTVNKIGLVPVNQSTRVSDVAFVEYVPEDRDIFTRVNGQAAVGIDITRQSVGNTLDISRNVKVAIAELEKDLPDGVELIVTSDDGIFIESSISEVITTIGLATAIVIGVIYIFLSSFRTTLIPAITIPLALAGTVAAIWLAGFSINTISLLALVLATGMVVDDTIVVTENIVRKRQAGLGAYAAAAAGTNEVFFAVISTTATLAAVFIPISFLGGQVGGVFSEFGFVLAFAVTLSSVAALTLVPVLAALLDPAKPSLKLEKTNTLSTKLLNRTSDSFNWFIDKCIYNPVIVIATALAFVVISIGAALNLSSTITPSEDRGFFLVQAVGPLDATKEYIDAQALKVEEAMAPLRESNDIPVLQTIVGIGGDNNALVIARLDDWTKRDRSQQDLVAEVQKRISNIPGASIQIRSSNSLNIRGGGSGLTFAVTGDNVDQLYNTADQLLASMADNSAFVNPSLSNDSVQAQLEVTIDEEMATLMGLNATEVEQTISALVQGEVAVSVFEDDTEIDVNLLPGGPPIDDPTDIESMFMKLPDGSFAPLSALASLEMEVSRAIIERQGGALAVSIRTNLAEGVDLGSAISELNNVAESVLDDDTNIIFTGEAATLSEGNAGIALVFGVALLVVFLVLSAQFESITSAVVIMLTVPFGLAAALMAISLSDGSLNYYSQIGLVLLIGVMAKNGILIVEFANQLRAEGDDIDTAIRQAMQLRIRPVMMTMVSTVLGGLPLIITSGAGAEARIAVGWVIVGGLGLATIFTLVLTPVLYRIIAAWGGKPGAATDRLEHELVGT